MLRCKVRFYLFFFSSRRRHTRFDCDWSSDVCSSDLITSSLRGRALPKGFLAFGEVGLAGEVRPAPRGQERLKEAAKLGFTMAVVPKANAPKKAIAGLTVHAVERVDEAMNIVRGMG